MVLELILTNAQHGFTKEKPTTCGMIQLGMKQSLTT